MVASSTSALAMLMSKVSLRPFYSILRGIVPSWMCPHVREVIVGIFLFGSQTVELRRKYPRQVKEVKVGASV